MGRCVAVVGLRLLPCWQALEKRHLEGKPDSNGTQFRRPDGAGKIPGR